MLANDSDVEVIPHPHQFPLVSDPATGSLTLNADGSITFTPPPTSTGPPFTNPINDSTNRTDTATVTVVGYPGAPDAPDGGQRQRQPPPRTPR